MVFPGNDVAVRGALHSAMQVLRAMETPAGLRGVVEIVLAEVLNNVVEHAYGEGRRGVIELVVRRAGRGFAVTIRDEGRAMPNNSLPKGQRHDLAVADEVLPEGGFGWMMIRELTEDLRYVRRAHRNELCFVITEEGAARH